jgi:hypothetical protein
LRQPFDEWFQTVMSLEAEFQRHHNTSPLRTGHHQALNGRSVQWVFTCTGRCNCFAKTRIFIRMRCANRETVNTERFVE